MLTLRDKKAGASVKKPPGSDNNKTDAEDDLDTKLYGSQKGHLMFQKLSLAFQASPTPRSRCLKSKVSTNESSSSRVTNLPYNCFSVPDNKVMDLIYSPTNHRHITESNTERTPWRNFSDITLAMRTIVK